MPEDSLRILGIDPGTASVGYGVIDFCARSSFECLASGIISTPRHLSAGERLGMIRADLMSLISQFQPQVISVEAIFFFKNAKTVIPVAQARGVILEAAASCGVKTAEYTPMQVKQTLTGFGRADKKLVQETIQKLLNHADLIRPDDAADAIAIAICHARLCLPDAFQAGAVSAPVST